MTSAYINSIGKYSKNVLTVEPLHLPTTTEEVQVILSKIGMDRVWYEEIHIVDYEADAAGLRAHLGESESIDKLNYLICLLGEIDGGEMEKFEAAVALKKYAGSVKDLINLTQNLDYYNFYPDVKTPEELERCFTDGFGSPSVPRDIKGYLDYEVYGRDLFLNSTSDFTDGGYIGSNQSSFTEYYDGGKAPEEHQISSYLVEPRRPILEMLKKYRETPPPEYGGGEVTAHRER